MFIKYPATPPRTLVALRDFQTGHTYRDIRNGCIWLSCTGGWANLTANAVVTRSDNMPGTPEEKWTDPRYEEIGCTVEVRDK